MIVYKITNWDGEPAESEEMQPKWFIIDQSPLNEMWGGDKLWLPNIIKGEKLRGATEYEQNQQFLKYHLSKL